MNKKFHPFTALFLTLALLLPAIPAAAAEASGPTVPNLPADDVYEVPYQYLKDDGSGDLSSIHTGYAVQGTGKLTISDGQAAFSHEMKSIHYFEHIAVLKPGEEKAAITRVGQNTTIDEAHLSRYVPGSSIPIEDSAEQSGIVTLDIADVYAPQTVLFHIAMTEPAYSAWHNVILELDLSQLPLPDDESNDDQDQPAQSFTDTATHWAIADIDQVVKLGIVNGYSDGSFRPDAIVTRGEFAVMISRALGLEDEGDAASLQDFGSIPDWAQAHAARSVAAGIIGGFEDATFRPDGHLTRAQLAVIIARAANLELDADADLAFADAAAIPTWAQQEVAAAVEAGLVQGKDGNRFDPDAIATRAEALTLIIRLLDTTKTAE